MKTCFIIQLCILLLIIALSEGIFFAYPKNALTNFFQTLRGKKDRKPSNVHHYHLYYYPTPVHTIATKPLKAPERRGLDELHSEKIRSLGWPEDEEYIIPDPKIIYPSKIEDLWNNVAKPSPFQWDSELFESISSNHKEPSPGVVVQVPLHQQIIIQTPPEMKTEKPGFLSSIFQKINNLKNSLFHSSKSEDEYEERSDKSSDSNTFDDWLFQVDTNQLKSVHSEFPNY